MCRYHGTKKTKVLFLGPSTSCGRGLAASSEIFFCFFFLLLRPRKACPLTLHGMAGKACPIGDFLGEGLGEGLGGVGEGGSSAPGLASPGERRGVGGRKEAFKRR